MSAAKNLSASLFDFITGLWAEVKTTEIGHLPRLHLTDDYKLKADF
jgi:hypothetical protein